MSDQPTTFLPTYDGCFVCGQKHPTGICARFYPGEDGKVHGVFKPGQTHTGFTNLVHGGITTAFLDELMGWPICLQKNVIAYTGELTIRFKGRVLAGQTYNGTAYPGTEVKKWWEGRSELADEKGNIVAEATGRYFLVPEPASKLFASQMTFAADDMAVFGGPFTKPT